MRTIALLALLAPPMLAACSVATTAPSASNHTGYQINGPYVADSAGGYLTVTFTRAGVTDSLRGDGARQGGVGHFTMAAWQNDPNVLTWTGTMRGDDPPEFNLTLEAQGSESAGYTVLTTIYWHGEAIQQYRLHAVEQ